MGFSFFNPSPLERLAGLPICTGPTTSIVSRLFCDSSSVAMHELGGSWPTARCIWLDLAAHYLMPDHMMRPRGTKYICIAFHLI